MGSPNIPHISGANQQKGQDTCKIWLSVAQNTCKEIGVGSMRRLNKDTYAFLTPISSKSRFLPKESGSKDETLSKHSWIYSNNTVAYQKMFMSFQLQLFTGKEMWR